MALAAGAMATAHFASIASRPPSRGGPTTPTPRPEVPGWLEQHNAMVARASSGPIDLLFLGDSITRGWLGSGRDRYDGDGLDLWISRFEPRRAANFGIGSDRVEHLLWRVRHGELAGIDPPVVVLMIGSNNIPVDEPGEIAEGIAAVVAEVRRRLPRSVVLLMGLPPRGVSPPHDPPPERDRPDPRVGRVNRLLAPLGRLPRVRFIDFGARLLDDEGMVPRSHFPDYLHLSRPSYEAWAEAIEPTLRVLLGAPAAGGRPSDAAGRSPESSTPPSTG